MNITLDLITTKNLHEVAVIYNYYIKNSTATFHTEEITIDDIKTIIPIDHPKYKAFLIKDDHTICGYVYLGSYKPRQAYDRTSEITIYLKPGFEGEGIGSKVLFMMEDVAIKHDITVLLGIITGENESSIRLFEKCGYEKCAHFKQVGEKFGRILDVIGYQKILI